jgi:hypothetical protein
MKNSLFFGVSLLILSMAFGALAQAETSWETMLTCDGGKAVVDVDRDSLQRVQLVIRDGGIVDYFKRSGVGSSPGVPAKNTEVIATGYNDRPVYSGTDFRGFTESRQSSYSNTDYAYIWRDGNGVRIKYESRHNGCPAECAENPLSMQCESLCVGAHVGSKYDLADWYFRDCR